MGKLTTNPKPKFPKEGKIKRERVCICGRRNEEVKKLRKGFIILINLFVL